MLLSDVMWVISRSEADVFLCFRDKSLRQLRRRTRGRHRPCKVNTSDVSQLNLIFFFLYLCWWLLLTLKSVSCQNWSRMWSSQRKITRPWRRRARAERRSWRRYVHTCGQCTFTQLNPPPGCLSAFKVIKATDKRYLSYVYSAHFNAKLSWNALKHMLN